MITKQILFLVAILCISHLSIKPDDNKPELIVGTIISDVVMMTDDIAEIIITCKAEKDPKKIKALIASLIKSIASIVETIIEKRRLKKLNRSVSLEEFDFSEISSKSLEQEIEEVVIKLFLSFDTSAFTKVTPDTQDDRNGKITQPPARPE